MGHAPGAKMDFLVSRQEQHQGEDVMGTKVELPNFSSGTASKRGCDESRSWTP